MEEKAYINDKRSTRGEGFCEGFLAGQRHAFALKRLDSSQPLVRVADLGCGSYPLFLTKVSAQEKYGVDHGLPDRVVEGVRIFQHNINSTTQLPFEDNFFDAVTMLAVLEHIEPHLLLHNVKEMYRILKPDSRILITTPAFWTEKLIRVLANVGLVSSVEIDDHKNCMKPHQTAKLFADAGFPREHIKHGFFEMGLNFWLEARKPSTA